MFKKYTLVTLLLLGFITNIRADTPLKTAIASAHPLATAAGFEILNQGGNVFDAAVAVSATLAVVEPSGSGLGGGGYWLVHRANDNTTRFIDGREKAPLAAHKNVYVDSAGQVKNPRASLDGATAAAIPGLPAGLVHLAEHYGKLPLAVSLAPAIRHARNGFVVGQHHLDLLKYRETVLKQFPASSTIFLVNGQLPEKFALLRQVDLAETLTQLARYGRAGFYAHSVADKLLQAVQQAGGMWTAEDLQNYQVVEREPVVGNYRGIKVTSAPPSSAGGIVLLEALTILSAYDLAKLDKLTRIHLITEAMRRAYHDRALYLGDSDFVSVPMQRLLSEDYAAGLRSSMRMDAVLPSTQLSGDVLPDSEGGHTTHFSIIDTEGNRVAATLSINFPFGSGFVAAGTGVLLNDEMDDFVSHAGPNGYGLVGSAANMIAPGKRMLSSMTPTFLEDAGRVAVLGTPGGSRIISMVLLATLDFAKATSPMSWVTLPRFHHQYLPDVVEYENAAFTEQELVALKGLGHHLKATANPYGNMQAAVLYKHTHALNAASDPRGEGLATVK